MSNNNLPSSSSTPSKNQLPTKINTIQFNPNNILHPPTNSPNKKSEYNNPSSRKGSGISENRSNQNRKNGQHSAGNRSIQSNSRLGSGIQAKKLLKSPHNSKIFAPKLIKPEIHFSTKPIKTSDLKKSIITVENEYRALESGLIYNDLDYEQCDTEQEFIDLANLVEEPFLSDLQQIETSTSNRPVTAASTILADYNYDKFKEQFILELKINAVFKGKKFAKKHQISCKIGTDEKEVLNFIGQPVEDLINLMIERKKTKPSTFFYLRNFNLKNENKSSGAIWKNDDFYNLRVVPSQERGSNFWIMSPFGIAQFNNYDKIEAYSLAEFYRHKAAYTLFREKSKFFQQAFLTKHFKIWKANVEANRKIRNMEILCNKSFLCNPELYAIYQEHFSPISANQSLSKSMEKEQQETLLSLLPSGKKMENFENFEQLLSNFVGKLVFMIKNRFEKILMIGQQFKKREDYDMGVKVFWFFFVLKRNTYISKEKIRISKR